MIEPLIQRIQPFIEGDSLFMILPWVVAAVCMLLGGILFLFVRIALIRRGHSLLTGTCNLYFWRELDEYYNHMVAEGRSVWIYHTIRILTWIACLSLAVFFFGVLRKCKMDQERIGSSPADMRLEVMEGFE
jgi:hypothetical protein